MRTFIIAEAGVNHNGDLDMARKMVAEACAMGADAVKFQTFRAEELVTQYARKADYQNAGDNSASQYEMLKKLELSRRDHEILLDDCRKLGIEFMSTPFSVESARFLAELGMKTWKIPSGEITNRPLLEYIASLAPESVIMSTGMATMKEIMEAVTVLTDGVAKPQKLYLLHCTTAYPTPLADVNLRAMARLLLPGVTAVGYSDHTEGTIVAPAAVALDAAIIEKHFTLDKSLPGPDHKASVTPDEFRRMVSDIRAVEMALGSAEKAPAEAERPNMAVARKSIVAATEIAGGETFTADNLCCKRPGNGISPMCINDLIGRKAKHAYLPEQQIRIDELK